MGVLTSFAENAPYGNSGGARIKVKEALIESSGKLFDSHYSNYKVLGEQLESGNVSEQYKAATTIHAVESVKNYIESMKAMYGESVVQASLGTLVPRILDIVRIFYPNLIAQDLCDIQPLNGQVGQIFVMRPRYEQSVPGITAGAGSQVFRDYPTNNNYAAEDAYETVGTGNGSTTTFAYTVSTTPIRPGSVTLTAGAVTGTDDTNGNIAGTGIAGTVNYLTGAISLTFTAAPANAAAVSLSYTYSTEVNDQAIRTLAFDLSVVPIKAKLYPLRYQYSVAAGLAAQAHLAVDVQDTLAELVAQYIKVERDNRLIMSITAAATPNSLLNFDCSMTGVNYDKRTLYSQIEIKVDQAEALIQTAMGRGGVDFVLCGYNAANVFRNSRSFRPEPVRAPIGAHKIGTLRDGTVAVIKVVNTNVMPANAYVFGFKGYMTGDSATILAEWIPMYFSPVFQSPTLVNSQGCFSAYDLYTNNPLYYMSGVLSNYSA